MEQVAERKIFTVEWYHRYSTMHRCLPTRLILHYLPLIAGETYFKYTYTAIYQQYQGSAYGWRRIRFPTSTKGSFELYPTPFFSSRE